MKYSELYILLEKYNSGTCTEEERLIVERWYLSELQASDTRPTNTQIDRAQREVWVKVDPKRPKRLHLGWWSAAASVFIAICYLLSVDSTHIPDLVRTKSNNTVQDEARGDSVLKSSTTENSMLELADGSVVVLGKGSQLTVLEGFNTADHRSVMLEGKAFFDIAHDPNKPFIIHTRNVRTKVLGTAFDIMTSPGKKTVKVNVVRGSVEVKNTITQQVARLRKNMQAIFDESDQLQTKSFVNLEQETAWSKADIEFNDITLADAVVKFEENFGYEISIADPELKKERFTYAMRADEDPNSFMKSFCAFIKADYVIDHQRRIISIKPINQ